jgi:electron transport complex protein RnfE
MARSIVQEFTKGLWDEVPPFRLVLGLCPVLAVTKSVENGIGMGVLKLGIFIPLIVVNCIVLGRSEAFASKNGIFRSLLDGLGMGIGFTLSLSALAAVRELLGTGDLTIWEKPIQVFGPSYQPFSFMIEAPGAFVALGLMLCLMNLVGKK